jgi:hypothetical protein
VVSQDYGFDDPLEMLFLTCRGQTFFEQGSSRFSLFRDDFPATVTKSGTHFQPVGKVDI